MTSKGSSNAGNGGQGISVNGEQPINEWTDDYPIYLEETNTAESSWDNESERVDGILDELKTQNNFYTDEVYQDAIDLFQYRRDFLDLYGVDELANMDERSLRDALEGMINDIRFDEQVREMRERF